MKVLVIDDEKPTLSMFKLFLDAYGYDVYTAEDGETGLARCREIHPEIVFTDIKMPGIDGLEVLSRIKQMEPSSEVVIITGHGDMEKAVEALDLGASDFINKPVEREALNSALVRAEKRLQMPDDIPFDINVASSSQGDSLNISLGGKLSAPGEQILKAHLDEDKLINVSKITLTLEETFSIDRTGIALLMETLHWIKKSGMSIVFKDMPFNYSKIFQMAGMDKLAVIENKPEQD